MRHNFFLVPVKVNAIGSFYCSINAELRQKEKIATRWPAVTTAPSERSRRWMPYGWG